MFLPTTSRTRRLAAGLTVAAAVTVLGASPASAQGTAVTAGVSAGTLLVGGTPAQDTVIATGANVVVLVNRTGRLPAGPGCAQLGASTVRCTGVVNAIRFDAQAGDDRIENRTATFSAQSGGPGNDILIGGSGDDQLVGGEGVDRAFGGDGSDRCDAESETACEP